MITQQQAIDYLNDAEASDIIEINQGLTNEVLIAPTADGGGGINPAQKTELIEYLNDISFNSGLDINDHLLTTAVTGKHPCD